MYINLGPVQYLADENSRKAFKDGWITGQRTRSITVELSPDYRAIGIRFNSTGVFPFLGFPASELTDEVVELEDIWQGKFSQLREHLLESSDIQNKFLIVEKFLVACLREAEDPHAAISYTAELLRQSRSEVTVRDVANRMNISHKHLIRQLSGMAPSEYLMMLKADAHSLFLE